MDLGTTLAGANLADRGERKVWGLGRMCSESQHTLKNISAPLTSLFNLSFLFAYVVNPDSRVLFAGSGFMKQSPLLCGSTGVDTTRKVLENPYWFFLLFCQSQQMLLQLVSFGPKAAKGPFRAGWRADPDHQPATLRLLCVELCPLKTHMLKS